MAGKNGAYGANDTPVEESSGAYSSNDIPADRKPSGAGARLADVGRSFAQGALGATQALPDAAGAGNRASGVLETARKALGAGMTPERQAELRARQDKIKQAEASGSTWEEVKAHLGGLAEAPASTVAQGLGSLIPTAVAALLTRGRSLAAPAAVGAVQGAGAVKGEIYDAVERAHLESGMDPAAAKARAEEAQSYAGENRSSIVAGAGLGAIAGSSGVESVIAGPLTNRAVARSMLRRAAVGAAAEAIPEGAQGAQERLSANLAQQREGFPVPTMQGVVGQGALEGVVGGIIGGGISAASPDSVESAAQPAQPAQPAAPPAPPAATPATPPATPDEPAAPQQPRQRDDAAEFQGYDLSAADVPFRDGMSASRALGIIPGQGPISAAAATAVDTGATMAEQQRQANEEAQDEAGADGKKPGANRPRMVDPKALPAPQRPITGPLSGALAAMARPFGGRDAQAQAQQGATSQPGAPADARAEARARLAPQAPSQGGAAALPGPTQGATQGPVTPETANAIQATQAIQAQPAIGGTQAPSDAAPDGQGQGAQAGIGAQPDRLPAQPAAGADVRAPAQGASVQPSVDTPVDMAAHTAATSPTNDRPEPTEAQKQAGNYPKGHLVLGGIELSIENPDGSTRSGKDASGKAWTNTLKHHYGYIKGTVGNDKDHVDVFVKPGTPLDYSGEVFVVDQVNPATGKFDEHKVMIGFDNPWQARLAYQQNYAKGWKGLQAITPMGWADFKAWVFDGPKNKSLSEQVEAARSAQIDANFAANREALKGLKVGDQVEYTAPGQYTQADGSVVEGRVVRGTIERIDDAQQGRVKVGNASVPARMLRKVGGQPDQGEADAAAKRPLPRKGSRARKRLEREQEQAEKDAARAEAEATPPTETDEYLASLDDEQIKQLAMKAGIAPHRIRAMTEAALDRIPIEQLRRLGGEPNEPNPVNDKPMPADLRADEALLLMPCSEGKLPAGGKAKDIYQGVMWQSLRANLSDKRMPQMAILSAKHGFLGPEERVEPYEQRMTPERAAELNKSVEAMAEKVGRQIRKGPVRDVMIVGGEDYRDVMRRVVARLISKGAIAKDASVRETRGGIGQQRMQLGKYARHFADGQQSAVAARPAKPAGGKNLRSAAYDKNPLMTFLATHGLYHKSGERNSLKSEFSPDKAILVPGYGTVFRQTGKQLDALLQPAIEDGYLPPDATETDLFELIASAIRGQRIAPLYAQGGAEAEAERLLAARFDEEPDETDASLADLPTESIEALDDDVELWPQSDTGSQNLRRDMEAMGFTEQEIEDEIARGQGAQSQAGQGGGQPAEAALQEAQAGDQARAAQAPDGRAPGQEGLTLTAPTRSDVLEQQDRRQQADALDERAQVEREASGFTLQAQTADNRQDNTGDMFGGPSPEDVLRARQKPGTAPSGPDLFSEPAKTLFSYLNGGKSFHLGEIVVDGKAYRVKANHKQTNRADWYLDIYNDGKVTDSIPFPALSISGRTVTPQEAGALLVDYLKTDSDAEVSFTLAPEIGPGAAAAERFAVGRSLTKEQRKKVLDTLVDVYKLKGAPKEFKRFDSDGREIHGYAYSPDLFEKSDITGAMVRYLVTLPDGRVAHPTELFPDYKQSDIDAELARREYERRNLQASVKQYTSEAQQFDSAQAAATYWTEKSDESLRKNGHHRTISPASDRTLLTNGQKVIMVPTAYLDNGALLEAFAEAGWTKPPADPRNAPDAGYSAQEPKKTYAALGDPQIRAAVKKSGDYDTAQTKAIVGWISRRPDAARIVANLNEHAGTPWAKQSLQGVLTRAALEEYVAGRTPKFDSFFNAPSATGLRELLERAGADGAWQYIQENGTVGSSSKPVNSVSSSFIDCNPSADCAKFCYAAKGLFAFGNSVRKSELMTWAAETDPRRLGKLMAAEYATTAEYHYDKALRLFDKGDGTDAWLPVIEELNSWRGADGNAKPIRVQVFSKNPEFLRKVPAMNLRLLSIDQSNVEVGRAFPDLPVAFVYTEPSQIEFLNEIKDRVQVILPVKLGKKILDQNKIDELPKWTKPVVCPVDDGRVTIGPNRFEQTEDGPKLVTNKGEWNCTRCDKGGGVGCFHGSTTAKALAAAMAPVHTRTDEEVERFIAELRAVSGRLPPGQRAELLGSMGRIVSAVRAGVDIGTEGTNRPGDAAAAGADDGWQVVRVVGRRRPQAGGTSVESPRKRYTDDRQLELYLDSEPDPSQSGKGDAQAAAGVQIARRDAVAAVDALRSTESILAQALSSDYAARQRVSLVGQKIASTTDLAVLAQVYRDPRFETFRVVFTDTNNKVVSQVGLTSRLPGSTAAIVGRDVMRYLTDLAQAAKSTGAANFYLLHNHPSGLPNASAADLNITVAFARFMPGILFQGHVILDTNQYTVIDGNGSSRVINKDLGQPEAQWVGPFSGFQINSPGDVQRLAEMMDVDDDSVTLILATHQYQVKSVVTMPSAAISDNKVTTTAAVRRAVLRNRSAAVFAVGRNHQKLQQLSGLTVDSILVGRDGSVKSLASLGVISSKGPFPYSRRERLSPDTSPAFEYLRPMTGYKTAGQRAAENEDLLSAYNSDEVLKKQERAAQAEKTAKAQKMAQELLAKREQERREIAAQSVQAAATFELGGDAMQNLTGQDSLFARGNPFFSALEREISGVNAKAQPAIGWLATITGLVKAGKVKADEVEWSGMTDWLRMQQGKVTREQVLEYLRGNGVQITETTLQSDPLKAPGAEERRAELEAMSDEDFQYEVSVNIGLNEPLTPEQLRNRGTLIQEIMLEEAANADHMYGREFPGMPKWNRPDLVLPGGTNYREVLLTLPRTLPAGYKVVEPTSNGGAIFKVIAPDGGLEGVGLTRGAAIEKFFRDSERYGPQRDYRSSHWDQPNVLAHIRVNDRTDADGKRVLFVEEIQSDWGQQGKKEGFADGGAPEAGMKTIYRVVGRNGQQYIAPDSRELAQAYIDGYDERTRQFLSIEPMEVLRSPPKPGIPSAPFVTKTDAWVALALKRIIKMAADEGYDRVALINGEQSAERYDLSKQVKAIHVGRHSDGTYSIGADTTDGPSDLAVKASEDKLADYVGKELAERIIKDQPTDKNPKTYSGLDLKVGGEGMRAFYDQIVPSVLKDVLRKVGGGAVSKVDIGPDLSWDERKRAVDALWPNRNDQMRLTSAEQDRMIKEYLAKNGPARDVQPGFDITPAMRERAADGLPLFDRRQEKLANGLRALTPQGGMTVERVRQIVQPLVAKWDVDVRVVATPADLPVPAPADARGMHLNGVIYLVASTHSSKGQAHVTLYRTLAHEAVAHYGLRSMLGREAFRAFVNQIQFAARARPGPLREISDYIRRTYVDQDGVFNLTPAQEGDEIAARVVELGVDPITGEFKPGFGMLKAVFSKVAEFLRNLGIQVRFSNLELQGMLVRAQRGMERGAAGRVQAAPAMSRAPGFFFDAKSSPLYKQRTAEQAGVISKEQADKALASDAVARRIMAKGIEVQEGDRVGARLNINVLKNTGVAVNTIHRGKAGDGYTQNRGWWGGEVIAYAPVVTLTDAYFNVDQRQREGIAMGQQAKAPMASIDGKFRKAHSFDGVEFRFNPKREHLFRDALGRVLKRADEVTITGNSAFVRGEIEYYGPEDVPARAGDAPSQGRLLQPGDNSGSRAFARAWHGTHQRGIDKFSTDYIGTGEGNQSYGWGLYFASLREVGEYYRKTLAGSLRYLVNGQPPVGKAQEIAAQMLDLWKGRRTRIEIELKADRGMRRDLRDRVLAEVDSLLASGAEITKNPGQLYEVEVPEDSEMLDWDKPLSEQPEKVREALYAMPGQYVNFAGARVFYESPKAWMTGQQAYKNREMVLGSDMAASKALAKLGVKGIKYLDGFSRGTAGNPVLMIDGAAKTPSMSTPAPERSGDVRLLRANGDLNAALAEARDTGAEPAEIAYLEGLLGKAIAVQRDGGSTHNYVVFDGADVEVLGAAFARGTNVYDLTTDQAAAEAMALRARVEKAYEAGNQPLAERLDARLEALYDRIEHGNSEQEEDGLAQQMVREEMLGFYKQQGQEGDWEDDVVIDLGNRYKALTAGHEAATYPTMEEKARVLRAVLEDYAFRHGGMREGVTDAQVLDAAKDAAAWLDRRRQRRQPANADVAFARGGDQTAEFKAWFGDSKVVDASGKPKKVYRGMSQPRVVGRGDGSEFWTSNPDAASEYAVPKYQLASDNKVPAPNVEAAYLSMKNPYIMRTDAQAAKLAQMQGLRIDPARGYWEAITDDTREVLENLGYDGIIFDDSTGGLDHDAYFVFRPTQIRSAIGGPDIRFARGSQVVTDIASAGLGRLKDFRKLGLQALGRRQIVDLYGKSIPQLVRYNRLMQAMDADKNDAGAQADAIADRWGKLKDERALAELMHDATLAQIDAAQPFRPGDDFPTYKALSDRFEALSDEAKAIYREARDSYERHYSNVRRAMQERIMRSRASPERQQALLARMDDEFFKAVKGVYFPLARYGDYVVVVRDADSGKAISVSRAETMNEAQALRAQLVAAYPEAKVSQVLKDREFNAARDMVGQGFMDNLYEALGRQDMSEEQRSSLEDMIGQLYLSALPDLSWAKHGIHRKGTPGFSQDARRAFAQNMFHGARYLAKVRYADLLEQELTDAQEQVDAIAMDSDGSEYFDQPRAQDVLNEMVKRHEAAMNPNASTLSTALTSLGFVFHLGLSPASAMVNLSQTALVAYPIMGAKWGFDKAAAALLRASGEAAKNRNDISRVLEGDEKRAYDEAVRSGAIDVTMAHDLAGIAQGEDAKLHWKMRPVMRWASFLFHHAERFNRQATFIAAYRLARDAGAVHSSAYEQAVQATYDGHFDYSATNRPRFMQGNVAKVILLFKQYAQNMIYTLGRQAYLAVAAAKPSERALARRAIGGLLASHAMAAGALGLPGVTTLLAVASMFGSDDDEPWDAEVALRNILADAFGPKPADVMARGLSRLTPFDISGRVGLDKLIFPDIQEGLEGQRWAESAMAAALGPVAGIAVNVVKGFSEMSDGEWARGLEAMSPSALRGPLKAFRYGSEGAIDRTGKPIVEDVEAFGVIGQALGFSPTEVRLATESKSAVHQLDQKLNKRRAQLLRRWSLAAVVGDQEGMMDAREDIERFNLVNSARRITPMNMAQSARRRRLEIQESEGGVYLPAKRRDAMEAGRFGMVEQ